MDRLTRHDLKKDKFVEEVAHSLEYVEQHKRQVTRYGVIALAAVVVAAGSYYFLKSRKAARQQALTEAVKVVNSTVGAASNPRMKSFATEEERQKAITKTLGDFAARYSGSEEAAVANYLLGVNAADQGRMPEARRYLQVAVEQGGGDYAALAKVALADVLASEGKTQDAEKLLREIIAKPSILVTKQQASVHLARLLVQSKPDEARKLLQPLLTESGAVGRAAVSLLGELPASK